MSSFSRRPNGPSGKDRRRDTETLKRKRVWFGPGTILALMVAGGVVAMQAANRPSRSGLNEGRVTFAADSSGHVRRVEAGGGTSVPAPAKPLWKPEVALLLGPAADLELTARQKGALRALGADWQRDKHGMETSLLDASRDAAAMLDRTDLEHGAPLKVVREGLQDYSALSREYDARRAYYWSRAVEVLTPAQRAKVEQLAPGSAIGRAAQ